jgi:hypothetical protein
VKVFSAVKRLMAIEFVARYPDCSADALLDDHLETGEPKRLQAVQRIFLDDEYVRLVRMAD